MNKLSKAVYLFIAALREELLDYGFNKFSQEKNTGFYIVELLSINFCFLIMTKIKYYVLCT